jgi:hypothetical protein
MVLFLPVRILTEVSLRAIFTGIIFMKSGKRNIRYSGIGVGQKPGNVKAVPITKIARGMGCTTGMATRRAYSFATMKN